MQRLTNDCMMLRMVFPLLRTQFFLRHQTLVQAVACI